MNCISTLSYSIYWFQATYFLVHRHKDPAEKNTPSPRGLLFLPSHFRPQTHVLLEEVQGGALPQSVCVGVCMKKGWPRQLEWAQSVWNQNNDGLTFWKASHLKELQNMEATKVLHFVPSGKFHRVVAGWEGLSWCNLSQLCQTRGETQLTVCVCLCVRVLIACV